MIERFGKTVRYLLFFLLLATAVWGTLNGKYKGDEAKALETPKTVVTEPFDGS